MGIPVDKSLFKVSKKITELRPTVHASLKKALQSVKQYNNC